VRGCRDVTFQYIRTYGRTDVRTYSRTQLTGLTAWTVDISSYACTLSVDHDLHRVDQISSDSGLLIRVSHELTIRPTLADLDVHRTIYSYYTVYI
jgi:hypothetical protein